MNDGLLNTCLVLLRHNESKGTPCVGALPEDGHFLWFLQPPAAHCKWLLQGDFTLCPLLHSVVTTDQDRWNCLKYTPKMFAPLFYTMENAKSEFEDTDHVWFWKTCDWHTMLKNGNLTSNVFILNYHYNPCMNVDSPFSSKFKAAVLILSISCRHSPSEPVVSDGPVLLCGQSLWCTGETGPGVQLLGGQKRGMCWHLPAHTGKQGVQVSLLFCWYLIISHLISCCCWLSSHIIYHKNTRH